MTDRERIILLLGSLYDLAYFPPGSLRSSKGLTPARKTPCPDCSLAGEKVKGSGWVTDAFKRRRPCLTCGGQREPSKAGGWAEKDRGRGWVQLDGMDAERAPVQSVDAVAAPTRAPRMVACDACGGSGVGGAHLDDDGREYRDPCRRCNGAGKRPKVDLAPLRDRAEWEPSGDPLADAVDRIAARDASGSYRELEAALAALVSNATKPEPFRALRDYRKACRARGLLEAVYVVGVTPEPEALLTGGERVLVRLALEYLEWHMPAPVRVPAAVAAAAKRAKQHRTRAKGRWAGPALKKRNAEIRRHLRDGRGAQWIAAEYGLPLSDVYRIVRKDAA